jgi:PhnB protein
MTIRPERYRNAVVAHIYVDGAADAVEFYRRAFGADELFRVARPDGKILHGELAIADSVIMFGDPGDNTPYAEPAKLGRTTAGLHLMVDDVQRWFDRALVAGAKPVQPAQEMFYGATSASVRDPYGHVWVLLAWHEDPSPADIEARGGAFFKQHTTAEE